MHYKRILFSVPRFIFNYFFIVVRKTGTLYIANIGFQNFSITWLLIIIRSNLSYPQNVLSWVPETLCCLSSQYLYFSFRIKYTML